VWVVPETEVSAGLRREGNRSGIWVWYRSAVSPTNMLLMCNF
jgi:hypothetical protein